MTSTSFWFIFQLGSDSIVPRKHKRAALRKRPEFSIDFHFVRIVFNISLHEKRELIKSSNTHKYRF